MWSADTVVRELEYRSPIISENTKRPVQTWQHPRLATVVSIFVASWADIFCASDIWMSMIRANEKSGWSRMLAKLLRCQTTLSPAARIYTKSAIVMFDETGAFPFLWWYEFKLPMIEISIAPASVMNSYQSLPCWFCLRFSLVVLVQANAHVANVKQIGTCTRNDEKAPTNNDLLVCYCDWLLDHCASG